ncbi:histone H1.2-like [Tripterygium wilfordii]|uniref:Histone H1.2-like n=1 Tax=Tripterygium wilfordii TaxID=458696 RepID=A0A7J7C997_TRIWF|nr:histone H1-like [Tripterygium wilfordii]KAF5730316.1 histone H1.2-like [Tripterygium wilfordii]
MDPLQPPPQPPAGATTEQPPNNIAHAANPAPPLHPAYSHPPYAEMIHTAITALKERDGSSKRAIAKYIERAYTDLPPTHSALLTHHLKRLKLKGLLVMVKKSYKLPRSDPPPGNSNPVPDSSSPPGAKRGRGRPPKPKPIGPSNGYFDTQPNINAQPDINAQPTTDAQPTAIDSLPSSNMLLQLQPVLVSVGLVDEPAATVRRGPGRPRKSGVVGQVGGLGVAKRGRGRPPGSGPKMAPGRPRKPKSVTAVLGPKRGPGRPPKTVVVPYASPLPSPVKARGRPKKFAEGGEMMAGLAAEGGEIEPRKRPGRPPKVGGPMKMKPRKSTGRPVGRPKKIAASGIAEVPQLQATHQDFRRKLEFFQSKVKQAVGVLKPQLTNESAISAVAAIQELEGLASMDISTIPLREEVQAQQVAQTMPLTIS